MSDYAFDFTQGEAITESIGRITQTISTGITEMEANVERSLAEWTGSARETYHGCKQQWDNAAGQMAGALGQAQSALAAAAQEYGYAESSSASGWSQSTI